MPKTLNKPLMSRPELNVKISSAGIDITSYIAEKVDPAKKEQATRAANDLLVRVMEYAAGYRHVTNDQFAAAEKAIGDIIGVHQGDVLSGVVYEKAQEALSTKTAVNRNGR